MSYSCQFDYNSEIHSFYTVLTLKNKVLTLKTKVLTLKNKEKKHFRKIRGVTTTATTTYLAMLIENLKSKQ